MIASTKVMMLQPCWNITNQSDGERRSSEKHFEYLLWPFTTYGHFWVRCTHRWLQMLSLEDTVDAWYYFLTLECPYYGSIGSI